MSTVEVSVTEEVAKNIIKLHAGRSQEYAGALRKRSDGTWVVSIPAGQHIVGFSQITGGPIVSGPPAPGPWREPANSKRAG